MTFIWNSINLIISNLLSKQKSSHHLSFFIVIILTKIVNATWEYKDPVTNRTCIMLFEYIVTHPGNGKHNFDKWSFNNCRKLWLSTISDTKVQLSYKSTMDVPSIIAGICENSIQKIFVEWKTSENRLSKMLILDYDFDENGDYSLTNMKFELFHVLHNGSQIQNLTFSEGKKILNSKHRSYLCDEATSLELKNINNNAVLYLEYSLPFHHDRSGHFSTIIDCRNRAGSSLQIVLIVVLLITILILIGICLEKLLTTALKDVHKPSSFSTAVWKIKFVLIIE